VPKLEIRPPKKPYITDQQALDFHQFPTPGKLALLPTKPMDWPIRQVWPSLLKP